MAKYSIRCYAILKTGRAMPKGLLLRRAQTIFTEEEFAKITAYLKKKGLRMYTLLKKATLEYLERHP